MSNHAIPAPGRYGPLASTSWWATLFEGAVRQNLQILLPFLANASVDWAAFEAHVGRTADAGLTPAVNMDTGYVQLLDRATATEVLDRTAAITGGRFVAGAYVADTPGDRHDDFAHFD